jgi:DNA polymerase
MSDDHLHEFKRIVKLTGDCLERLLDDGITHIPIQSSGEEEAAEAGRSGEGGAGTMKAVLPSMEELAAMVARCRKCGLWKTRSRTVFGTGAVPAAVIFVGEAPGAEEDKQGLPFVGRAGQLLTRMLASIGLTREEVYITNVLKSRPPGNRDPHPDEVASCEPYLLMQLAHVKPLLICALGRHAAQTLLKTTKPIGQLRGRFHDYHGIKILPTFHPAYLLRNPADKRKAWEDLKKVRAFLNERA